MKKIKTKKIYLAILFLLVSSIITTFFVIRNNRNDVPIGELSMSDTKYIYVSFHSFWDPYGISYKIDMEYGKVWVYASSKKSRDLEAKNEGYHFWKNLDKYDLLEFQQAWKSKGFDELEGEYEQQGIMINDGGYWYITQVKADGREIIAKGYEAYPDDWSEMSEQLKELLGIDILNEERPKPKFRLFGIPHF